MVFFISTKNKSLLQVFVLTGFLLTACANQPTAETEKVNISTVNSNSTTPTGFYWPTGVEPLAENDNWLASGCNGNTDYFKGEYHIGRDIPAQVGDNVYAISDGQVLSISPNGWGIGNVALLIKHKLANGNIFIAVYGHIKTSLGKSESVTGGMQIGTIGKWDDGNHLHFGIRPGTSLNDPFGRMPCPNEGDANGFEDPILWINSNAPGPMEVVSSMEISQSPTLEEASSQSQKGYPQSASDVPVDIPIPSDAYKFYNVFLPPYSLDPSHDEKCSEFAFRSNLSHKELEQFYRTEMEKLKWKLVGLDTKDDYLTNLYYQKGSQRSGIFIYSYPFQFFGKVNINFSDWYYTSDCEKIADDIPILNELRGGVNNGYTHHHSDSSPEQVSTSIDYLTPYTQEEVAVFYLNELPNNGWTFVCTSSYEEAESFQIQFEKPGRESPRADLADTDQIYISIYPSAFNIGRTIVDISFYQGSDSESLWKTWCWNTTPP